MLGRHGCEWAYNEMVVMENEVQANVAFETFVQQLDQLEDFKKGLIRLDLQIVTCDKPILRLRQAWKSENVVRFVTDGNRLGINVKPKKVPYIQCFMPEDESE